MEAQKLESLVARLETAVKALESKGMNVTLPAEVSQSTSASAGSK
jgi:hypothetical protein